MAKINIESLVSRELGWKIAGKRPAFLKKYRWWPKYLFYDESKKVHIAVDVIYNQQISVKIYEDEAKKAKTENAELEVCLFSSFEYAYDTLRILCSQNKFGLKIYGSNVLSTIVPLAFEEVERVEARKAEPEGWFPDVILYEVKKIRKLKFANEIVTFAKELGELSAREKQLATIRKYIDDMLCGAPYYKADALPFMRLSHFENLLSCSAIESTDHIFHSARVFLVGCVIIERFYKVFRGYYRDILGYKHTSIEYMWLLASLFHDIGRVKQDGYRIYLKDPKEERPELKQHIAREMSKAWQDEVYRVSLGNVVELIRRSCATGEDRAGPFVGYALGGALDNEGIANVLTTSYNELTSHGVISCFELSADLVRKLRASKSKSKTFLLYHVFPAVLAIAFHDWKIWQRLEEAEVFPIEMKNFPLAALLIYIDTWDDYKRGKDEKIRIDRIEFGENNVTVGLTWLNPKDYLDEKLKYESFVRNVRFSDFSMKIEVSNAL
jgi:hypothetical protein